MKIVCMTTFLDGPDRFEAADVRTVDDERAAASGCDDLLMTLVLEL